MESNTRFLSVYSLLQVSEKKLRAVKAAGGGGSSLIPGGGSGSSGGSLFRLKFRKPESTSRSRHQRHQAEAAGCSSESGGAVGSSSGTLTATDLNQISIYQWGNEEVASWLESIQLDEYRDDFIRHDIRGPELLTLERRDLKELGIHKVGHIKRLQQAIWEIKEYARTQHHQQHQSSS